MEVLIIILFVVVYLLSMEKRGRWGGATRHPYPLSRRDAPQAESFTSTSWESAINPAPPMNHLDDLHQSNPATGLSMSGSLDVGGNPYGNSGE